MEWVFGDYFGYLVIYSFLGYVAEVIYGLVAEGVIESRQSFIYGPINTIYGVGAILMLLPLKKLNSKSKTVNFLTAGVLGCILEYVVSAFGEHILHVKWWDYTNYFLNINGRVCLYFAIFWGILGLWMLYSINPKVDAFIDRIKSKFSRSNQELLIIFTVFALIADLVFTIMAVDLYQTRIIVKNDLNVKNKEKYVKHYDNIYSKENLNNMIMSMWGDDFMVRTYPDLKIVNASGDNIVLADYCPDSQRYYFKVFERDEKSEEVKEVKEIQ